MLRGVSASTPSLGDLRSTYQSNYPIQNNVFNLDFDFFGFQFTSGLPTYTSSPTRLPTPIPEAQVQPVDSPLPRTSRPTGMADPDLHAWWTTIILSHSFMVSTSTGSPPSLEYISGPESIQTCSGPGCQRPIESGAEHKSSFYKRATEFTCEHPAPERLCELCEVDAVWRIAKGEFKCSEANCSGILRVQESVVWDVVGGGEEGDKLVREFLDLLGANLTSCIVCDEKILTNTPKPTRNCEHVVNACKECMGGLIEAAIEGDDWHNIRCPELECRLVLDYEDVNMFANEDLQNRYQELLAFSALEKMPEFVWCQHGGCNSGQLVPEGSGPQWLCQKCRASNCFKCKTEWHYSLTCDQVAEELLDTDEVKRRYCKRCPGKGCGVYIQKNGGCHEVACSNRMCKVNFCWECKVILDCTVTYMTRGTKGHLEGCEAPYVKIRRVDEGFETVTKPDWRAEDSKYREGWDVDEGYVGTGHEYGG